MMNKEVSILYEATETDSDESNTTEGKKKSKGKKPDNN